MANYNKLPTVKISIQEIEIDTDEVLCMLFNSSDTGWKHIIFNMICEKNPRIKFGETIEI